MNKELRTKLKRADNRLKEIYCSLCTIKGIPFVDRHLQYDCPESYIKTYIYTEKVTEELYRFRFNSEPCVLSTGNSHMSNEDTERMCKFWAKSLRIVKELNELNIVCSYEDINTCIVDIIANKRC